MANRHSADSYESKNASGKTTKYDHSYHSNTL
jgi:hypothetical protein